MPIVSLICPDNGVKPIEVRVTEAIELQAILVNSKLRLFKANEITLTGLLTLALLEANECDFDGYPAGGITLAAFGDPIVDSPNDTVLLPGPSKQFNWAHVADDVANDVGGAFLVDSDGNLRGVVELEETVTLDDALDGLSVQYTQRV